MAMFPSRSGSRGGGSTSYRPAFLGKSAGLNPRKPRLPPQHTQLASKSRWQGLLNQQPQPGQGGSRGGRSTSYRPAFLAKTTSAGLNPRKPELLSQHTQLASKARWQGLLQQQPQPGQRGLRHHQQRQTGEHTDMHRPRWGWLAGAPAPAYPVGGPITIEWQEPTSLDDAIGQPGAGVFIIENAEGDAAPQPVQVGAAAEGFAQQLQSMQLDPATAGAQQVRLGLISIRGGNRADRAAVRAVAHHIAARISASGAAGSDFPAEGPSPSEQRLLQQRPIQDSGAVPDYLAEGG
jgi:hypothetical protein